mmetsp:Transcript_44676/g.148100  ORF Transcript_44676/g.148100 Transcript_44676/m.148100 type:complete len:251 (+) Transcript_44676:114-866(+)
MHARQPEGMEGAHHEREEPRVDGARPGQRRAQKFIDGRSARSEPRPVEGEVECGEEDRPEPEVCGGSGGLLRRQQRAVSDQEGHGERVHRQLVEPERVALEVGWQRRKDNEPEDGGGQQRGRCHRAKERHLLHRLHSPCRAKSEERSDTGKAPHSEKARCAEAYSGAVKLRRWRRPDDAAGHIPSKSAPSGCGKMKWPTSATADQTVQHTRQPRSVCGLVSTSGKSRLVVGRMEEVKAAACTESSGRRMR